MTNTDALFLKKFRKAIKELDETRMNSNSFRLRELALNARAHLEACAAMYARIPGAMEVKLAQLTCDTEAAVEQARRALSGMGKSILHLAEQEGDPAEIQRQGENLQVMIAAVGRGLKVQEQIFQARCDQLALVGNHLQTLLSEVVLQSQTPERFLGVMAGLAKMAAGLTPAGLYLEASTMVNEFFRGRQAALQSADKVLVEMECLTMSAFAWLVFANSVCTSLASPGETVSPEAMMILAREQVAAARALLEPGVVPGRTE